jgi:hypothetical protein
MPSPKSTIQDVAAIVVAIAAVVSVVAQSKENPRLAVGLVLVAALIGGSVYLRPLINFVRRGRARARRNKIARAHYPEFLQFAKRLWKFINPGDSGNLRNVISTFCGNEDEKLAQICPPDYLKDIYPIFLGRLERTQPTTESDFCQLVGEFSIYVASYNSRYVLEPFRRMRARNWKEFRSAANAARAQAEGGQKEGLIFLEPWIESLPEQNRPQAERQIEAFREAWVSYLNDLMPFLEKLNDALSGNNLPTSFERPQKL